MKNRKDRREMKKTLSGAVALAVLTASVPAAAPVWGMEADPSQAPAVIQAASAAEQQPVKIATVEALTQALATAADGAVLELTDSVTITSSIHINKAVTLRAVQGAVISTAIENAFILGNGAVLDGLTIKLTTKTAAQVITMGAGSTVKNTTVTGLYTAGASEVSRAITISPGASGVTITDNTFESLRQPAYINNGVSAEVIKNTVKGTKGFVVVGESQVTFKDNTFANNDVDIAVIEATPGAAGNVNNYTNPAALSKANNGCAVDNQIMKLTAEEGAFTPKPGEDTLINALEAAQEGDVIRLSAGNYTVSTADKAIINKKNITLQGAGSDKTTIDFQGNVVWGQAGMYVTADNVMVKDLALTTSEEQKLALLKFSTEQIKEDGAYVRINRAMVDNVKFTKGGGLNFHCTDEFIVDGAEIFDSKKVGISVTASVGEVKNTTTSGCAWGDIGIMSNGEGSRVTLGDGNTFGGQNLYVEAGNNGKPTSAEVGCFEGCLPAELVKYEIPNSTTAYIPLANALAAALKVGAGVITLTDGVYTMDTSAAIKGDLTIQAGEGTPVIQFPGTAGFQVGKDQSLTMHGIHIKSKEESVRVEEGTLNMNGVTLESQGVALVQPSGVLAEVQDVVVLPSAYQAGTRVIQAAALPQGLKVASQGDTVWYLTQGKGDSAGYYVLADNTKVVIENQDKTTVVDSQGNPADIEVTVQNLQDVEDNVAGADSKTRYEVVVTPASAAENPPQNVGENVVLQALNIDIQKTVGSGKPVSVTPAKAQIFVMKLAKSMSAAGVQVYYAENDQSAPVPLACTVDAENAAVTFAADKLGKFWIVGTPKALAEDVTVEIEGAVDEKGVVGQKLTAAVSKEVEGLEYQWYRSTENGYESIEGATKSTYTLTDSDKNKNVRVGIFTEQGAAYSENLAVVYRLPFPYQDAVPARPTKSSATAGSITLKSISSPYKGIKVEYGIGASGGKGILWQSGTVFSGLSSDSSYTFYARYAESDLYEASEESQGTMISTNARNTNTSSPGTVRPGFGGIFISSGSSGEIKDFQDLGGYAWAKPSIDTLCEEGIILGTSDTTFSPAANIKRGDLMLMLSRMIGFSNVATSNFADVPADSYYALAIGQAKSAGIATGYDNEHFGPEDPITRQDLITLCYRAFVKRNLIQPTWDTSSLNQFWDKDSVAPYAMEAMATMVTRSIIIGADGAVNPNGNATRAEVAVMFARLLDLM